MKSAFEWGIALLIVLALGFGATVLGMYSKSFFGKWDEEIRYDIQKESAAHRDGMQRNLSQLMIQYGAADVAGRMGIRATVQHQYSQENTSEYPAHLKTFLNEMGL